jgi:hypothetical protein
MLLSALYVRFRDIRPIWEVLLQMIFYGSPILYVLEIVPNVDFQHLIVMLNPLATLLVQMRHSLIDPNAPDAWEAAGGGGAGVTFSSANPWTGSARWPDRRLDYVLVSGELAVDACAVVLTGDDGWGPVSDHYGVRVQLRLTRG